MFSLSVVDGAVVPEEIGHLRGALLGHPGGYASADLVDHVDVVDVVVHMKEQFPRE